LTRHFESLYISLEERIFTRFPALDTFELCSCGKASGCRRIFFIFDTLKIRRLPYTTHVPEQNGTRTIQTVALIRRNVVTRKFDTLRLSDYDRQDCISAFVGPDAQPWMSLDGCGTHRI